MLTPSQFNALGMRAWLYLFASERQFIIIRRISMGAQSSRSAASTFGRFRKLALKPRRMFFDYL
jgi:hypothetical protein